MGLQIHIKHCEQSYKTLEKVEQGERNGNMKIGREERDERERKRWIKQREKWKKELSSETEEMEQQK